MLRSSPTRRRQLSGKGSTCCWPTSSRPVPTIPRGWTRRSGQRFDEEPYLLPPNEPLTLSSHVADSPPVAYLEHLAVGSPLVEMPLFLNPDRYINVPLESTYLDAYRGHPGFCAAYWKDASRRRAGNRGNKHTELRRTNCAWAVSLLAGVGGWWAAGFTSRLTRHIVRAVVVSILLTPAAIEKCDRWIVPAWWPVLIAPILPSIQEVVSAVAIFVVSLVASIFVGRGL